MSTTRIIFRPLLAIVLISFKQCVRQPLYLVLTLSALLLIGIHPLIAVFTFEDHLKLVIDGGLATLMGFGWLLGVFSAHHSVNQDFATNAITLIMAKPVNKSIYFIAKQLGLLAALSLYFLFAAVGVLASARIARDQFDLDRGLATGYFGGLILAGIVGGLIHYFKRKSFSASVLSILAIFWVGMSGHLLLHPHGNVSDIASIPAWETMLKSMILIHMAILVMGVIAAVCSLRCNLVMNLGICGLIFMVGLVSDYFLNVNGYHIEMIFHAVIPNWQLFWLTDALTLNQSIPQSYCLWALGYGLFLMLEFNLIGWLLLADMEAGAPGRD